MLSASRLTTSLHHYPGIFRNEIHGSALSQSEINRFSCNNQAESFLQALGLRRDDTFSVTMLGHCIEMYIGDSEAYIGKIIIILIDVFHILDHCISLFRFLRFLYKVLSLSDHSSYSNIKKLHLFQWNSMWGL